MRLSRRMETLVEQEARRSSLVRLFLDAIVAVLERELQGRSEQSAWRDPTLFLARGVVALGSPVDK